MDNSINFDRTSLIHWVMISLKDGKIQPLNSWDLIACRQDQENMGIREGEEKHDLASNRALIKLLLQLPVATCERYRTVLQSVKWEHLQSNIDLFLTMCKFYSIIGQ